MFKHMLKHYVQKLTGGKVFLGMIFTKLKVEINANPRPAEVGAGSGRGNSPLGIYFCIKTWFA
jgi:hypothetical protein